MVFRHFRIQCSLRATGFALATFAAIALFARWPSVAVFAGVAAVYQLYGLVRYVEKTNRELARFLDAIRYEDFAQRFSRTPGGKWFQALGTAFDRVIDDFRVARAEKEEQYRYLHTVVQHIGIGLVSFRSDESVDLINTAAKRLLRVTHLQRLDALTSFSSALVATIREMRSGDRALVKVVDQDELLQLSVYATEFKIHGSSYKLVSIQDIQAELEEKEIEAWQKLTRVLTHEIMNSITPISSLAATVGEMLDETNEVPAESGRDVREAVRTIERRSRNLHTFVTAYRSLTRIPIPEYQIFSISELFDSLSALLEPQLEKKSIRLERAVTPDALRLTADPELIEQVLINLLRNAMEAVEGGLNGTIRLTAGVDSRGRSIIQVADNGPGITYEALDKIFIPFYTTKKEGSGIGLSLSRQIMRRHGGNLLVHSTPGVETVFTLRF